MKLPIRRGVGFTFVALLASATLSACADVPTAAVGECISSDDLDGDEITSLPTFSCDEPHDFEVYEVKDLPDGEFPGDDAVMDSAEELCLAAFEPYVGAEYDESELLLNFITPTQATWESDEDREVLCLLVSEETTGSFKDSGK